MCSLLLNNVFISIMSAETILRIKSWYLEKPKSDPNTVIWLQIHMGSCLKSTLQLINKFYSVRSICLITIDTLYAVFAVIVGWHCLSLLLTCGSCDSAPDRQTEKLYSPSIHFSAHMVAGRIFSVISSSWIFLLLEIISNITAWGGRKVLVLWTSSIWLAARAGHTKGIKNVAAKLPRKYHCPWYQCFFHAREEQC